MANIPIGLQMYTVRDECDKDFVGALRRVKEIGYEGVELAGTHGLSAADLRKVLDDLGLRCAGGHAGDRDVHQVADYYHTLGCTCVGGPSLPPGKFPEDKESVLAAAKYMNEVGAHYRAHGLTLYYHNHAHEFKTVDGKYILDWFYENTDPQNVQAEIDVMWVQYADVDPAAYLRKYPNRVPLVHIKDMDQSKDFTEVGNGVLNWKSVLAACQDIGAHWYIVEQDRCKRPSFESAQISFNNLKEMTAQ